MKKRVKVEEEKDLQAQENEQSQNEQESGDDTLALFEELEQLRKEAAENYDKYLRAMADLDNSKKRFAKERSELLRYAGENLARDLPDVVDNLRRAANQESSDAEVTEYQKGISLIVTEFIAILARHGITTDSSVGQRFDPTTHDALASQPTDDHEPGIVIEELKQAYFFKDKLLRPAQVVVSSKPS